MTALTPATRAGLLSPGPFVAMTGLSVALTLLALPGLWLDGRFLADGAPVWAKPLKFSVSFVVLFVTLAMVADRMPQPRREGRAMRLCASLIGAAFMAEMTYIFLQAGRAEASHFNLSTPFHDLMYTLMGVGAVTIVLGVAAVGWLAARDPASRLAPGVRAGVFWGLTIGALPVLITAGYLGAQQGHHVGLHPADGATVPLFGWSLAVGDLRPAHFLALHAMQVLPLAGLWFDRAGKGAADDAATVRRVRLVALAWFALTLAVFAQAMAGRPLLPL